MALAAVLGIVRAGQSETQPKIKIAYIGDSTADGLWGGMTQLGARDPCLKSRLDLGRHGKISTGLTRPDRFDWAAETKRIAARFKPQLFVMSIGLNDRQSVSQRGRPLVMDNAPEYPERYKERVTEVLKSAQEAKTPLRWVGLSSMRPPAADADARLKNTLFADAIREFGDPTMKYIEPWRLNPDGEDKFQSFGPDQNGRIVQLRATDGQHFTAAGDFVVAVYILPKILESLAAGGHPICVKTEGEGHEP